jgi:hypothetical protein
MPFPGTNGNNNRLAVAGTAYDTAGNVDQFDSAALDYNANDVYVQLPWRRAPGATHGTTTFL